ncbi:MAG: hypothetical protein ACLPSL_09410 [Smithella sp.]
MIVPLFIPSLDFGDVGAGCIVPFLVAGSFGGGQVGLIVPGEREVWETEE